MREFRGPCSTVPHFAAATTKEISTDWLLVDQALDSVLRASGSALLHYTMPATLELMRKTMLEIIEAAYMEGSNDCHNSLNRYL